MKRYIKAAISDIGDEDLSDRKYAAGHNTDNKALFENLVKDPDRKVREQLAKNPNTPSEILKELSTDKSYLVRAAVAKNPNTPSDVLSNMVKVARPNFTDYADAQYLAVGAELFKNPNTPMVDRISLLNASGMRYSMDALRNVARNKNTPMELLLAIADIAISREYGYILEALARNRNTPADTLQQLYNACSDGYYALDIRGALARNPNTPVDVLLDMLNYEYLSEEDRDVILKHRNLPKDKVAEVQTALAEEKKKNSIRSYIGKDAWLLGELYGISRDFLCYFRIVRMVDSRKKIYEVNVLYDITSWNDEPIEKAMQETEIERFDDSEESDGKIYKPVTTYTTDELLKKLYPNFDED